MTASNHNELETFRRTVRQFLEREVQPHYAQWEKDGITPRGLWQAFGDAGLLCVDTPEDCGGYGAPFQFSTVVLEEVSRMGFGALAANLSVHSDIVAPYIAHLGTDAQKQQWLPGMVTGAKVGAIAMTEPGTGSDLQSIRTTARREGDHYVLNGAKTFITNGQHADVVVVAARSDSGAGAKGISLFLLDSTLPGYARGRNLEKIGQHCGDTSELFFKDVRLPADALLGGSGQGFAHLMQELPRERLVLALGAVAAAEGTLQWTIDYVTQRKAFGQPLAQFQNTRFRLAEMKTDIQVHNAFVQQCMHAYQSGMLDVTTAAMAKYAATEMQCRVADGCLQLFGGYGYMAEYPVSRAFVDARVQRIYGGTSEIMKEIIARSLVGGRS